MAIHETPFYFRVCFGCKVINGFGNQEASIKTEGDTVEVILLGAVKGKLRSDGPNGFTIVEPYRAPTGFRRTYGPGEKLPLADGWRAIAT